MAAASCRNQQLRRPRPLWISGAQKSKPGSVVRLGAVVPAPFRARGARPGQAQRLRRCGKRKCADRARRRGRLASRGWPHRPDLFTSKLSPPYVRLVPPQHGQMTSILSPHQSLLASKLSPLVRQNQDVTASPVAISAGHSPLPRYTNKI